MKIHLDGQTKVCGSIQTIMKDSQATIVAKGNLPGASCVMKFTTADTTGVCSVCFEFEKYAFFNSTLASISIKSGPMSKVCELSLSFSVDVSDHPILRRPGGYWVESPAFTVSFLN